MSDWEVVPQAESDWAVVQGGEPEEGGPESFLSPETFKPSKGQRKFKNQTGPIEQVRETTRHEKTKYPTETADILAAPGLSMFDRLTLGGLTGTMRLSNQINQEAGKEPVFQRPLEAIEGYRANSPTLSQYTDIGGYLTGGPRAIASGVERIIPQVANPAAQAARATVAAGASSALTAGAESATRGDDTGEFLRETGRGAAGGIAVGAPLSAASALMGAGARAVLGSKGAKAREYLESRNQPLTAPDTSDAAIGAAAQRTDEAVKNRLQAYRGEVATQPYLEALDAIPQSLADQPVNVTPIYRDLALAANDPTNLRVADKLNLLVNMLGDRPLMTQQELNGLRQSLAGIAGVGETTAGKMAPLRRAYESVKALVDRGPYAEANRRFSGGIRDFDESLDMVGLRSTTNPDEPIAGNLRVASQRQGQNTVTAGADTERLDIDAFKAKHPELANVVDAPEILRNQGDLAFHAGPQGHGGLIERLTSSLPLPAVITAAALGHGWKGAAAAAAMAAYANRNAIAGRVLYNPAQNAQIAAQMMLMGVPAATTPGGQVRLEQQ